MMLIIHNMHSLDIYYRKKVLEYEEEKKFFTDPMFEEKDSLLFKVFQPLQPLSRVAQNPTVIDTTSVLCTLHYASYLILDKRTCTIKCN